MADGGFDPCECIFNHEMAMRRLLSLLRSSQTYCTDNECLQDGLPGPGQPQGETNCIQNGTKYLYLSASSDNFMMLMMGWMLMAVVMYFLRPNSMRSNSTEGKPSGELLRGRNCMTFPIQVLEVTLRAPGTLLQVLARATTTSVIWRLATSPASFYAPNITSTLDSKLE